MAWARPDFPIVGDVVDEDWGDIVLEDLTVLSTHAHTGAAGQGAELAHSAMTGVSVDQHHAEDHAAEHEPGDGDGLEVDAVAATGSLRTLGSGAQQAAAGNHAPH